MLVQDDIDAARPGSIVRVPRGEHRVNLVIDKPLTLLGDGPESILDGGGEGPVIRIDTAPDQPVTLSGLLIRRGSARAGGGVCFGRGLLAIHGCVFTENSALACGGGAIYAGGQELKVERCELRENLGRQGGAVLLSEDVEASFVCVLFASNRSRFGGGLRLEEGARCTLEGCTLADNEIAADGQGSQIYLSGTTSRQPALVLENSIVSGDPDAIVNAEPHPGSLRGARVLLPEGLELAGVEGLILGAPGFRKASPTPYALERDSVAVGKGDPARLRCERDLLGHPRVAAGGMDLGAYARVGSRA